MKREWDGCSFPLFCCRSLGIDIPPKSPFEKGGLVAYAPLSNRGSC